MTVKMARALRDRAVIQTRTVQETGCEVTQVRINGRVDVGTRDGWLCFWTAGREVRVGPLTPEQAEKLSEDLGYDVLT
jgi:hypothetical protein